ncbi:nucleotidyltransferase domain-containing protein [Persephonella sp. KM09-Lau-8]|uniref:nucleotidyltransferase domain-containing protein n=1 Tax=Persephonella sp. KM09-Lau-8 TaxID=1158345 RepID=UPI0004950374|nr:nucleotidyltransferase domain-containing protein [Persephonella sp. KM09-Lau-8]
MKKEVLKLDKKAKLIIYGSKVRGDFDEESDIDILIILGNPLPELKYKIIRYCNRNRAKLRCSFWNSNNKSRRIQKFKHL